MAIRAMEGTFGSWVFSEEEALKTMNDYFEKLFSPGCKPSDKETYFHICHTLYKEWECVRAVYVCHPRQRFYKDKLRRKQPRAYSQKREEGVFYTDEMSQCSTNGSGLYFVSQEGFVNGEHVYAVKVGETDDLKTRLSVYRTHNPFIEFDGVFLPCAGSDMKAMESNCYNFLNMFSCNDIKAVGEWVVVTEDDYDVIQRVFKDSTDFAKIAEGRD